MPKKRLFIIDAMAMAFRNFHAFSARPLTTSAGIPVSAVYGSAMFVTKLIEDEKPDYLIVVTDSKEKNFRHEMYDKYKANRLEMPADLAKQLPYFFELFEAMDVPVLKTSGVEADDVIGSIVTKLASDELECFIVSGDKDFMQLVNQNVFLYCPKKNEAPLIINFEGVFEKFKCKPDEVIDILALIGDVSDNVPGVKGIGEKGAAKLIADFHTLENLYENLEKIPTGKIKSALVECKEMAFLSKKLVTIKTDVPFATILDEHATVTNKLASEKLADFYRRMEFKSLVTRTLARLGLPAISIPPPPDLLIPVESEVDNFQDVFPPQAASVFETISKSQFDYICVKNRITLDFCLEKMYASEFFSFDTETTGLDIRQSKPIGASFSTQAGQAFYIPFDARFLEDLTVDEITARLRILFSTSNKTKIAHNAKFDIQMLKNMGIEVLGPFRDTMIMSHLINASKRDHSLDSCVLDALNYKKIATKSLMGPKFQTSMLDVPIELLSQYACEDADMTLRLFIFYKDKILEKELENAEMHFENPLISVLANMEWCGIHIDKKTLAELSVKQGIRIEQLEKQIHGLAGEEFNVNSPKQLQVILFEKLKVQEHLKSARLKKTKSGYSTDVSVLEQLKELPIGGALLEYRVLSKLKNTYVDSLPKLINSVSNRVHTSFNQTGTATGRLSSSDPNLQNIPIRSLEGKEIRKAFCAKDDNHVIISADYSQIELRLLAHIANEQNLRQAFLANADIHSVTASKIFNVAEENVTGTLRSRAKAINFGIIYGMGPMRLARETGVSMGDAKIFIEKYFAGFPKIGEYIDHSIAFARQHGYCKTISGRRRPLPDILSQDRLIKSGAENMAVNTPIQGSASDLIKRAMIMITDEFWHLSVKTKMLLQVHDELVFEAPRDEADDVALIIKKIMENALELTVPLKVEIGIGSNWLDAH